MKWCLHKGAGWCELCQVFHCDPFVEITTLGSRCHEYLCNLCGGFKYEPVEEGEYWPYDG